MRLGIAGVFSLQHCSARTLARPGTFCLGIVLDAECRRMGSGQPARTVISVVPTGASGKIGEADCEPAERPGWPGINTMMLDRLAAEEVHEFDDQNNHDH